MYYVDFCNGAIKFMMNSRYMKKKKVKIQNI